MRPDLIIVGLGNPGASYAQTRHNAGWMALDHLASSLGASEFRGAEKFLSQTAEVEHDGVQVLLVKPMTFMNRSGECIRKFLDFYKLDPLSRLLVIVDDVDLPLGTTRLRPSGGAGTHNGMRSIVACIGEGFPRYRIGIGPSPQGADLATWVLSRMSDEEVKSMQDSWKDLQEVVAATISNIRREQI